MTGSQRPDRARTGRTAVVLGFSAGLVVMLLVAGGAWWLLFGPSAPRVAATRTLGEPGLTLSAHERRGETVYNANCLSCHGGPTGGDEMSYPPRHNANGHTWHHAECELVQIIREGGDEMTASMRSMMAPPDASPMPAFKSLLSSAEIDAALAYIKLMWTPQQRSVEEEITREQCAGT